MSDDGLMNRGIPVSGAVDLAALAAANKARQDAEERAAAGVPAASGALVVNVTEANFQADVIDRSYKGTESLLSRARGQLREIMDEAKSSND